MKFKSAIWIICLTLACGNFYSENTVAHRTYPIKLGTFADPREHGATDLFIYSPWEPGQYAQLTFPEHCWGENLPNTSHDADPPVGSPWMISEESTRAVFESHPRDSVVFRARAEADSMAVRLYLEIENNSNTPVNNVRALVCFKPDATVGTPSREDGMLAFRDTSYQMTYFPSDGRKLQLHEDTHHLGDLPPGVDKTNIRTKIVWGINIKGRPDIRSIEDVGWWYIGDHPGRVVEERADPALIAIHARNDTTRWIGTIWHPSSVLFCNPLNPCFHSDPAFKDCPAGERTGAEGVILFHNGTFDELVDRALAWEATRKIQEGPDE